MGYLFFYVERFLWILWNLCEIFSLLAMIIFSCKDRKERRDLLPFVFHACAGVVANFVTTRVRRVVSSKFSSSSSLSLLCPPETGGTRSNATEGVDITLNTKL